MKATEQQASYCIIFILQCSILVFILRFWCWIFGHIESTMPTDYFILYLRTVFSIVVVVVVVVLISAIHSNLNGALCAHMELYFSIWKLCSRAYIWNEWRALEEYHNIHVMYCMIVPCDFFFLCDVLYV